MSVFEPFAEVPLYPLVFPVFWGAAAFFALAMARHLRVFAAARQRDRPTDRPAGPARGAPSATASSRPGCSATCRAGIMHFGDLLGLRPAHDRDGEHRHRRPHPGDRLESRSTALLWAAVTAMQNVVAVVVLVARRVGDLAAPGRRGRRGSR